MIKKPLDLDTNPLNLGPFHSEWKICKICEQSTKTIDHNIDKIIDNSTRKKH